MTRRLALFALALAAALAAWTIAAPGPTVDGRGILATALALAVVLVPPRGAVR